MQQFKLSLRFKGSELDWVAVSLKIKWSKIYISLCAAQLLLLSLLAYFYFLLLFSGEVPIWYLDWLLLQSWLKEQFVSDKMLHGVDLVRVQFRAYFAAIKPAFLCKLFKTCVQVSLHQWKPRRVSLSWPRAFTFVIANLHLWLVCDRMTEKCSNESQTGL